MKVVEGKLDKCCYSWNVVRTVIYQTSENICELLRIVF